MRDIRNRRLQHSRQRGAALIMGLLILVVMILLTLAATGSTLMQTRMAGYFRDTSLAFQASEAASRWGMAWLLSLDELDRPFPCASDSCIASAKMIAGGRLPTRLAHLDSNWTNARSYGINPTNDTAVSPAQSYPLVSAQPRFLMEEVFFKRDDLAGPPHVGVAYYRITSLGYGATSNTHAVLSAVMGKRYQ